MELILDCGVGNNFLKKDGSVPFCFDADADSDEQAKALRGLDFQVRHPKSTGVARVLVSGVSDAE